MTVVLLSLIPAVALVAYSYLLFITAQHRFERPVNRYFAAYLVTMIVWSLGALLMYVDRPHAVAWNKVMLCGLVGMPLTFFGFVQAFRGMRVQERWVRLGLIYYFVLVLLIALGYMAQDVHVTPEGRIEFSFGPAVSLFALYYLVFLGLAVFNLAQARREAREFAAQNRVKYITIGLGLVIIGGTSNVIPALGMYPLDITANVANAFLTAYAIFRYHLLDISIVIRKGLLYTIPTVIIGAGYVLIIFLAINLFHLVTGAQIVFLSLILAVIVAVAAQPLRDRAQNWVDRAFFREKYDAGLMLERLSRRAAAILDMDRLADLILDEIVATMHITTAALLLREQGSAEYVLLAGRGLDGTRQITLHGGNPIVEWLARRGESLTRHDMDVQPRFKALWAQERTELEAMQAQLFVPLLAQNELIGILVLGPKRAEAPYTPDDHRTLLTVANQTAIALQNAWLYQAAVEEKERAELILERAFAGIMVVDPQLRIVTVNPATEEITGYSAQELQGEPLSLLFGSAAQDKEGPFSVALVEGRASPAVEMTLNSRHGARNVLLGVTPIRDGLLLNFTDITHLKEIDRLKSEIVANVSHELRTPLACIKGYAELLLADTEGDDRELRHRFLSIINEETDRLADFINELLDLARLESGRVEPAMDLVSLRTVIEEVVQTMDIQARKAQVALRVDVPHGLPLLLANRELLHSVVKNLVSNAIKFSPRHEEVEISVHTADHAVVLEVADHGAGIPAEDLPHLFTKFYRGTAGRQTNIRGTGLGLVLAKEAVEAHHGTIEVSSVMGRGTRFIVTLPITNYEALSQVVA